jgi:hypothetical protein
LQERLELPKRSSYGILLLGLAPSLARVETGALIGRLAFIANIRLGRASFKVGNMFMYEQL